MTPAPRAAIVLAGGRGMRLGAETPKALVPFAGRPLLARAVDLAQSVADVVLVAAPSTMPLDLPAGALRIDDLVDGAGPLAGLVPGFERAVALGAESAFAFAVDLPRLTAADLASLVGQAGTAAAIVPRGTRGLEPQVAWIGRVPAVATAFRAAWDAGQRSLHGAYEALGSGLAVLDVDDPSVWPGGPAALRGVNTPAEFAAAERAALEAADPAP